MPSRSKWDIIRERKLAKKVDRASDGPFGTDLKWRNCGLCGRPYCCNNYPDRKTRISRYRGVEICAFCKYNCIKYIPKLEKLKVIKIKKVKK